MSIKQRNQKKEKIALVDVGGGLRDIFGCGVLDYCMDNGIEFDHCIGVSAGCANIGAFLARQSRRDLYFYMVYAFRDEYISLQNFIKTGNYVGLDYIYSTLTNEDGEYPLDYDALVENPSRFTIVASNAVTGKVRYFEKKDMPRNNYDVLKATSCLPVCNRPQRVGDELYYDGGLGDPIPVKFAVDEGADKVIIILTKPVDDYRESSGDRHFARLLQVRYPEAAKNLVMRSERYNTQLDYAKELERQGRALILAPDDIEGMKTLTKDRKILMNMYLKGYKEAEKISEFLGLSVEDEENVS